MAFGYLSISPLPPEKLEPNTVYEVIASFSLSYISKLTGSEKVVPKKTVQLNRGDTIVVNKGNQAVFNITVHQKGKTVNFFLSVLDRPEFLKHLKVKAREAGLIDVLRSEVALTQNSVRIATEGVVKKGYQSKWKIKRRQK